MSTNWQRGVRDPARLAALADSGLVGTPPDDAFDRLVELATALTGIPRGCVTLVDSKRTTAMSAVGFPDGIQLFTPVEQSFCRFVVGSGRPLVVDDSRTDPRTMGDPAIESFAAAAWAGFPIEDADGAVLGTFCLMHDEPHEWTSSDLHLLATLAKAASSEIALRRCVALLKSAQDSVDKARVAATRRQQMVAAHLHALAALGGPAETLARELAAQLTTADEGERPTDS